MSIEIKVNYVLKDENCQQCLIIIPHDTTCDEFLEIISQKQKKKCISLSLNDLTIPHDAKLKDYLQPDQKNVFMVSIDLNSSILEITKPIRKEPQINFQPLENPYIFQHQKFPQLCPIPPISPPEINNPDFYKIFIDNRVHMSDSTNESYNIYRSVIEPHGHFETGQSATFSFYFTGGKKDDLFSSQKVSLDLNMTPDQCSKFLLEVVLKKYSHLYYNKQILVYFAGGVPFIEGKLGDLYLNEKVNAEKVIYGILTNKITEEVLNAPYHELCNICDEKLKLLLSPLSDSSDRGLCEIACLLGYFNHGGFCSDVLLRKLASVTNFPPLITSLKRIIENDHVVGRDVVTVCSTLFSLFKSLVPETCKDCDVFEYTLKLCGFISNVDDDNYELPLINIDDKLNLKNDSFSYFWLPDFQSMMCNFNFVPFEVDIDKLNYSSNEKFLFHPISPLLMKTTKSCSIVSGKNHEFLFLMQSPLKDLKSQNKAKIIDPFTGQCETKDIEDFAREQECELNPREINQVIMFDLCESESLLADFDNKTNMLTCAYQYITTFISNAESSHLQNFQGLVSFSDKSILRCQLTSLLSEFERKFFKDINPDSKNKNALDSISFCCDEIIKIKDKFCENSTLRIIVFCDDIEEDKSSIKAVDLIKKLMKNQIIVDSIILNSNRSNFSKLISVVSHITKGFSFNIDSFEKGLSLFEQDAFINIALRKMRAIPLIPSDRQTFAQRLKPDKITDELINNAIEHSEFDTEIKNLTNVVSNSQVKVAIPAFSVAKNVNNIIRSYRQRRILRELHFASLLINESSQYFDPDIKIFPFLSYLDRWKVFIKGEEGSPYEKKWWYIYVEFPEEYPFKPPLIRFSSIPFHLNVSSEGRICLNSIEKDYIISKHVIEILQEVKELFFHPCIESSLSIPKMELFINDYEQFVKFAKKSTIDNAKDSYLDYLEKEIIDEISPKFILKDEEMIPQFMISQISGRKIHERKVVQSSTGIYYNRDDLMQIVCSNKNPTCIVTGKILIDNPGGIEVI